jgi:hypothetical protein
MNEDMRYMGGGVAQQRALANSCATEGYAIDETSYQAGNMLRAISGVQEATLELIGVLFDKLRPVLSEAAEKRDAEVGGVTPAQRFATPLQRDIDVLMCNERRNQAKLRALIDSVSV